MGQKLEFGILLINPMSPSAGAVCPMNLNYPTLVKPADSCSTPPLTPCPPLNPNPWAWARKALFFQRVTEARKGPPPRSSCESGAPTAYQAPRLVSGVWHLQFPLPARNDFPYGHLLICHLLREALAGLPNSTLYPTHCPITCFLSFSLVVILWNSSHLPVNYLVLLLE